MHVIDNRSNSPVVRHLRDYKPCCTANPRSVSYAAHSPRGWHHRLTRHVAKHLAVAHGALPNLQGTVAWCGRGGRAGPQLRRGWGARRHSCRCPRIPNVHIPDDLSLLYHRGISDHLASVLGQGLDARIRDLLATAQIYFRQ